MNPIHGMRSFESKVLVAFAVSVLVVVGMAASTWQLAKDAVAADRWVIHTRDVLSALARTELTTLQSEYSTQGFRLTGDLTRLAERDVAVAARQANLERLTELIQDNPTQQQRMVQLKEVIAQRLAIARQVEVLVKTQGLAAANVYVRTAPLQETRVRVARILAEMDADERALLNQRLALQRTSRENLVRLGFLAAAALGLLLLTTLVLIRRQLRATQASQRALAESEESYAATVLSIGDGVVATDTQARITRMNRVAEQLTGWTIKEARGRPIEEVFHIVHETTRAPAVIPVKEVLASGEIQEIANHTLLISRQGTACPIADSAAPIRDATDTIRGVVLVFRDVTREHHAEQLIREQNELLEQHVQSRTQQLHESEARYKTVFLTSPEPIILTRLPEGLYLDVNDGFVHTFGWMREEVVGKTATDIAIWKDAGGRAEFIRLVTEQDGCENFEAEFVARSGKVVTSLVSAKCITIQGQSCMLSVVRDITERKRMDNALVASEKEFRLLAEAMPQIVWVCDAHGNSIYVNQQWADYTGLSADAYFAQGWRTTMHPDDLQRDKQAWDQAVRDRGAYSQECRLRRFDGQYGWWLVRGAPVKDARGEVIKWFGTCTHIDEIKRTEVALRQSEDRLNFAMERSQMATWDIDLDSGVVQRSDGHDQIFGYTSKLWTWSHAAFLDHVLPQDRAMVAEKFRVAVDTRTDLSVECRIQAVDGTLRWVWTCGGCRTDVDGRVHMAGILQDITQRKHAEEELWRYRDHLQDLVAARTHELDEARKVAEMASLAKSQFLANMSHEIRTPLGAISGMSRLLRREALSPDQLDHLDKLETAAAHLNSTINDILDLSKIEAGKFDLLNEPLQLDRLIAEVVDMCHEHARAKKLQISGSSGPLPAHLYGDPTRLRQALLNYLGNAVKFTNAGTIRLHAQAIEETDGDVLIRLEVQDTGIGIDKDKLGKLFQAFEQADSSTSRRYGGTGLGLVITKKLALAMGGDAGVTSSPGAGSTFWLTVRLRKGLPVDRPTSDLPIQNPVDRLRTDFLGKRVLVADDDDFNREIGKIVLEDVGLTVDLAEDGHRAVEMARQTHYDLILMDMQMPTLDGLDATRAIRQLPDGLLIPIVAMTANAFAEDKAHCLAAGMNDFITKPFDPQILYSKVLHWLMVDQAVPEARASDEASYG